MEKEENTKESSNYEKDEFCKIASLQYTPGEGAHYKEVTKIKFCSWEKKYNIIPLLLHVTFDGHYKVNHKNYLPAATTWNIQGTFC